MMYKKVISGVLVIFILVALVAATALDYGELLKLSLLVYAANFIGIGTMILVQKWKKVSPFGIGIFNGLMIAVAIFIVDSI